MRQTVGYLNVFGRQNPSCIWSKATFYYSLSDRRGNASVVVEESSSEGSSSSTFASDGDLTTLWEASTDTNVWVTLDLGDAREVTALRLQVRKLLTTAVIPSHDLPKAPTSPIARGVSVGKGVV